MQLRSLAFAIATGLALTAHAAPQSIPPETTSAVRFLRLADVPTALASTGRDPTRWETTVDLHGLTYAEAARLRSPVIAWIANASLADTEVRSLASEAIRHGLGVLITLQAGEARRDASTFGIGARGNTALYHRGADGILDVLTLADHVPDMAAAMRLWPAPARVTRQAASIQQADTIQAAIPDEVPHVQFRIHPESANGSSVAHHVTVLRDVTTSRDEKVVIVKARVEAVPAENGVSDRSLSHYESDGAGDVLTIPDSFTARTIIGWDSNNEAPDVRLERVIPDDSPDVNRIVEKSSGVSTSYGVSSSSTAEDTLKGLGISAIGKVPLQFSLDRTYNDTTSVSMVTQSYYTAQSEEDLGKAHGAAWRFRLANDIAGDASYFNTPGAYTVDTSKTTPMMRKASTELLSVWRVPGDFEGRLWIGSSASVENRRYSHNRSWGTRLDPSSDTTPDGDPPHWWFWTRGEDPYADLRRVPAQPAQVFSIDLDSPYLTSSPTVLIQSSSGAGDCLMQVTADAQGGTLAMAPCDAAEGNRAQQWNMDKEGRYRNRVSQQCLDRSPEGKAATAPCTLRLSQRWRWAADRVMAMTDGGTMQRLELRDGTAMVSFDPARHDAVVLNAHNALLPPWNNYPLKPAPGSTIPTLTTEAPPVPESYYEYREVPSAERWLTIPLRRSIQ
ncbi:RICIN domain-containing protein [Luteibacter aegosomaticola]|uniref:RICIN domain-containing protein n=1 Tax=Luteibacter aegosomaticola TaxID=2911538 RepID=UPI001FFBD937|nr:RICIN domain-containing protein [Luteibacter aegosomaticola]UPG90439.1 RICIN domain-containing protein [Luteibacter aegosomaticola]